MHRPRTIALITVAAAVVTAFVLWPKVMVLVLLMPLGLVVRGMAGRR